MTNSWVSMLSCASQGLAVQILEGILVNIILEEGWIWRAILSTMRFIQMIPYGHTRDTCEQRGKL